MPRDIQASGAFNTGNGAIYKPPEFFDSGFYKTGDIDKWRGQHRLVAQGGYKRLQKMQEGVLLVRFEMPFDVWCGGCGELVAMGVRFNDAEKKRVGRYFSTPIYEFAIRHHCGTVLKMQNDPKNITFKVTAGGKAKAQPTKHADQEASLYMETRLDDAKRAELRADPVAAARHREKNRAVGAATAAAVANRLEEKNAAHKCGVHAMLIAQHRATHGLYMHNSVQRKAELRKYGMALLPESDADRTEAKAVMAKPSAAKGMQGMSVAEQVRAMKEQKQKEQHQQQREKAKRRRASQNSADGPPLATMRDTGAADTDDYHVMFHRAGSDANIDGGMGSAEGGMDGDSDDSASAAGLPACAPPVLYNVPGSAAWGDISRVLSMVLGEPVSRAFAFTLSSTHHKDMVCGTSAATVTTLADWCTTHQPPLLTEEPVHLVYQYRAEGEQVDPAPAPASAVAVSVSDPLGELNTAAEPPAKRRKKTRKNESKRSSGLPGLDAYGE